MSDTTPKIEALVAACHQAMTPEERWQIASRMFDDARAIVESSLPAGLSQRERRLAVARRFYGSELPQAALEAFADYGG